LPFDKPHDPEWSGLGVGGVVLPAVTVVKGTGGVKIIPAPGIEPAEAVALIGDLGEPGAVKVGTGRVRARIPEPEVWTGLVDDAIRTIRRGPLSKVVLARLIEVAVDDLEPFGLLGVLGRRFPGAFLYAWAEGGSVFLGASPELLVERRGDAVRSFPLAGSATPDRPGDEAAARALLESAKDRAEHKFVVDQIVERLGPVTTCLTVPDEPTVVHLENIQHLGTEIEGRLSYPIPVTRLASALHPTPAVAGTPTGEAMSFIRASETFDRGWYAGAIGWTDDAGDGEVAVAVRAALVTGSTARLYAGAGIVEDSVPERELAETEAKLRALSDVLV
jgi:isochorismate synthase